MASYELHTLSVATSTCGIRFTVQETEGTGAQLTALTSGLAVSQHGARGQGTGPGNCHTQCRLFLLGNYLLCGVWEEWTKVNYQSELVI